MDFILIFALILGLSMMAGLPVAMIGLYISRNDPPRGASDIPVYGDRRRDLSNNLTRQIANNIEGHRMIEQLNRWDDLNNRKL